jgi:peptidoglycan/LPS O-acetylase OafA/YrhL
VAVVLVVAFHAGLPVPGGFVGVDVFFVISGFVITEMLLRDLIREQRVRFADFYARRFRRILPALAVVVVLVSVASVFLLSPLGPQQATARTGIAASLFSANLQLARSAGGGYFGSVAETNALLHTWSLSVEEQFYLVFPFLLMVVWQVAARFERRLRQRRSVFGIVLVATAVSFGVSAYTSFYPSANFGAGFAFYSPVTRAWEFGVGVLIALASPFLRRLAPRVAVPLGVVGAVLIGYAALRVTGSAPYPGIASLLPVVGAALLVIAGMVTDGGVSAVLAVRPAAWIGDVSYGWYLWHWPCIVFAAALWPRIGWVLIVAAVVSLVPTVISYRLLENPVRFDTRLTGRRVVPLVVAAVSIPVVTCLGLLFVNGIEGRTPAVRAVASNDRMHVDSTNGCQSITPVLPDPTGRCTWSVPDPRGAVYLVGDSNAGHIAEPTIQAANDLGYDTTVDVLWGCPFIDLIGSGPSIDGTVCHDFVTSSIAAMVADPPALVVIASSSSYYVTGPFVFRDPTTGEVARMTEEKARVWTTGLASVLEQLSAAGIPTVVVHPVPHLGAVRADWMLETCPYVRIVTESCGTVIGRAAVERQQVQARQAEDLAVAMVPLSTAVDLTDELCTTEACASDRNGLFLYRDATHLSIEGAMTLTDRFRGIIENRAK